MTQSGSREAEGTAEGDSGTGTGAPQQPALPPSPTPTSNSEGRVARFRNWFRRTILTSWTRADLIPLVSAISALTLVLLTGSGILFDFFSTPTHTIWTHQLQQSQQNIVSLCTVEHVGDRVNDVDISFETIGGTAIRKYSVDAPRRNWSRNSDPTWINADTTYLSIKVPYLVEEDALHLMVETDTETDFVCDAVSINSRSKTVSSNENSLTQTEIVVVGVVLLTSVISGVASGVVVNNGFARMKAQ